MSGLEFEKLIGSKLRECFGARSEIASLVALAGDASSRRYYRAMLNGSSDPRSMVIMQLPAGSSLPLSSEELAIFKEAPKELPFLNVQRFLSKIGVRVPRLYGSWEGDGILFLEDLGDQALWDRVQNLSESEAAAWYRKAIDELLLLQLQGTACRDETCIAFQQRFDYRLYMWEFDHFLQYGLRERPDVEIAPAVTDELRGRFDAIARALEAEPVCLSHRDYHSWNLMIHSNQVAVIDFQDALLAPPQYDLASLLNDRITDSIVTPELEDELLRYYVTRRKDLSGETVSADGFNQIYLLSAIQRDLKVVGRFYYLDIVKGKPAYMKFVPPTLRRLKRNLARLPETRPVIALLTGYFTELQ